MKTPEEVLQIHFEAKGYIFDHFKNWQDFRVHLPTIYSAMADYAARNERESYQRGYAEATKIYTKDM